MDKTAFLLPKTNKQNQTKEKNKQKNFLERWRAHILPSDASPLKLHTTARFPTRATGINSCSHHRCILESALAESKSGIPSRYFDVWILTSNFCIKCPSQISSLMQWKKSLHACNWDKKTTLYVSTHSSLRSSYHGPRCCWNTTQASQFYVMWLWPAKPHLHNGMMMNNGFRQSYSFS